MATTPTENCSPPPLFDWSDSAMFGVGWWLWLLVLPALLVTLPAYALRRLVLWNYRRERRRAWDEGRRRDQALQSERSDSGTFARASKMLQLRLDVPQARKQLRMLKKRNEQLSEKAEEMRNVLVEKLVAHNARQQAAQRSKAIEARLSVVMAPADDNDDGEEEEEEEKDKSASEKDATYEELDAMITDYLEEKKSKKKMRKSLNS